MPAPRNLSGTIPSLTQKPFYYLLTFIAAGSFLSYGGLSTRVWLWVLLLGIFLPLGLAFGLSGKKNAIQDPFSVKWELGWGRAWVLGLVAILAIGTRFYRLADLYGWPTKDEGTYIFSALETLRGGPTPFFYGVGEMPPLFRCLQAAFLEMVPPSLFSLWFFPALLSLATVPVGYWAARQFFSKDLSVLFVLLLATGFWPLFLGRLCMILVLTLLAECWVLGLLGSFLKKERAASAAWLGLGVGLGFYASSPQWAMVALGVTLAVLGRGMGKGRKAWGTAGIYGLTAFLTILPYLWNALTMKYGSHIQELWVARDSLGGLGKLLLCGSYLRELFWGVRTVGCIYGPVWGGLFNPLVGAFFLLGLAWLFPFWRSPRVAWVGLSLFLFLIPGFATYDLEMLRVILVLPLVLSLAAFGALVAVSSLPKKWKGPILGSFLFFSALLDFYHLAGAFPKAWASRPLFFESIKSAESRQAYGILEEQGKREGPGLIFLDFPSIPFDQTLSFATYSMNALIDPDLDANGAKWTALLCNQGYEPFLVKRFPAAKWVPLTSVSVPWGLKWVLGILPLDSLSGDDLRRWREASKVFHRMNATLISLPTTGEGREEALGRFLASYPLVQGDPFLESCFWEIAAFNHGAERKLRESLEDLGQVLQKGYPAAHIYNKRGSLLYYSGDLEGAKKAFEVAVRMGGDLTPAAENLRNLEKRGP